MAQQIFNDGSSGDVVIRSGPPASGGGGGSWGGGFGGNRVGASGAFVGVSKKRSRARALARQADRQAKEQQRIQAAAAAAHAQEQARLLTRQQTLAAMQASHVIARAAIDQNYAARAEHLGAVTDQEIRAKRGPGIGVPSSERWQLHSIERQRSLIDELVAQKAAALEANNHVAQAFDGFDPLTRTPDDYLARLGQFGDALAQGHQVWENSYTAAAEARLLAAQISALHDKSNALLKEHAAWVERLAAWEKLRQVAEQRDARIRFKQQTDAQARLERVRQANTLSVPIAPSTTALSMLVNPRGLWVAGAADGLAAGMSRAVAALAPLAGALGTLTAGQVAIFAGGMVIPSELGNGELTPEQRQRLYHAVVVPAQALELHDVSELQAIADTGGSVEMEYRAKTLETPEGTAVIVTRTGGEVDTQVPVLNATLDPLTDRYTVEVPGSPARHLEFMPQTTADANATAPSGAALTEPQLLEIPPGVDWRIQDCVVCVPGLEPVYVSFNAAPLGSGVVTGTGQPATSDWRKSATQASGAAIPTQIGDVFRGREFTSFAGFDQALWQTLGEDRVLASSFNELNRKRIEQGFAPYAPKSTWIDENREFELRYEERAPFWDDALNLDKISIKTPASAGGWLGIVPAVTPWPIPPTSSWKPLQPPGGGTAGFDGVTCGTCRPVGLSRQYGHPGPTANRDVSGC